MSETQTFTADQQKALEQFVGVIQADQTKVVDAAASFATAAVTGTFTVGPDGTKLHGWITYRDSGLKIYYELEGAPSTFWGAGAGAILISSIGVMRPDRLGGLAGTFEVQAALHAGVVYFRAGGEPVFDSVVRIGGIGSPFGWGARGRVRFHQPVA
jgi:hypothetical protein